MDLGESFFFYVLGIVTILFLPSIIIEDGSLFEAIYFTFLGFGWTWMGLYLTNEYLMDKFVNELGE
jgi:hypothetical protein